MLIQAILIALCAWIACSNIEFLCWSLGLCAPFMWGPIVGLILGDVQAGLAIGTTTMLVYLGNIVIGEVSEKYGGYKWQKLQNCADYFGYKFKTHDSYEDAKATLYCYHKIMERKEV